MPYQQTARGHYSRDETIWSSHDTIRIDTKGADMIIYDMIYDTGSCKNTNIHNIHIFFIYYHQRLPQQMNYYISQFYIHISNTVHIK